MLNLLPKRQKFIILLVMSEEPASICKGEALKMNTSKFRYRQLDEEIEKRILADRRQNRVNPNRFSDADAVRRNPNRDKNTTLRPSFCRDIEKILYLPLYSRYSDKTQVFSLMNNDDITRRGLHVQLVSRIARNIGRLLGLNEELIEAIALGHDLGHTPFGHAGERFLDELLYNECGRHFFHNIQSVRVLDRIYNRNISLQVLDGIACHNGEFELEKYKPTKLEGFEEFDKKTEECCVSGKPAIDKLVPSTLEGCVVRISDIIAYIGRDRQDAVTAEVLDKDFKFSDDKLGNSNAEIINNLIVDIVNNSYGKDYLKLSPEAYEALSRSKAENGEMIYSNAQVDSVYKTTVKPMFAELYYRLRDDLINKNTDSVIYRHHIEHVKNSCRYYGDVSDFSYLKERPDEIVADFISSMTDDYFVQLHEHMFPESSNKLKYKSYFST